MTSNTSGSPPGVGQRNGRPLATDGRTNAQVATTATETRLTELVATAQQLVTQIGGQAAADEARFRMAYKLGFEAGREVGRLQLDYELAEQDRRRMEYMHGISNSPAYAALELIRWDGRREDFGKPRPGDFRGFGAAYEPPTTSVRVRAERGAA